VKLRKVLLLFVIVGFGLILQAITVTRNVLNDEASEFLPRFRMDGFPFSRGSRFNGPSHDFTESKTAEAAGVTTIEISNEYGDVTVRRTSDPKAQISIALRKEVFTRRSESAEAISDKVKLTVDKQSGLLKIGTTHVCGAPPVTSDHPSNGSKTIADPDAPQSVVGRLPYPCWCNRAPAT
jgi:hypothetical protein